jgi:hypothetical protein
VEDKKMRKKLVRDGALAYIMISFLLMIIEGQLLYNPNSIII